ncbi:MAG TPA: hypothetical protein PLE74_00915 [Candidatus Cloacimonadota bacterium]|nr:hypothetical protein [Candidatus Cloacimonadota bacterium]
MGKLIDIRHPEYKAMYDKWKKWRYTYAGGDDFIDQYLKYYSTRETNNDFLVRKAITYVPAFAKTAIEDVRKAIFSRANDIRRTNGSESYQKAIAGLIGGVDEHGSSMNGYIGENVLTELLPMARVGIYVDMHKNIGPTMATLGDKHPYIYTFPTEDILSWQYGEDNKLSVLLLRCHGNDVDEQWGLPDEIEITYRYLVRTPAGVSITEYDEAGNEISGFDLKIKEIPFIILETKQALMADIANYQIALLNIASSDINYITKSNFPFYTEQYDPKSDMMEYIRKAQTASTAAVSTGGLGGNTAPVEGTTQEADQAKAKEIVTGAAQGRKYPVGSERPGFIHPSPEPLKVSMEKQDAMKKEIRELISLNLNNIRPRMASAESKELDNEGLVSGLAYLGVMLESTERRIAELWHMYENKPNDVTVAYPRQFTLQTEAERSDEAMKKAKVMITVPSKIYQKAIAKDIAQLTLGHKASPTTMDEIFEEIDSAEVMNTDPEFIMKAAEAGLVSNATASETIGFPKGEAAKASQDHAERLARIQAAQGDPNSQGGKKAMMQMADGTMAKDMKKISQDGNMNPINNKNKTRGAS